MKPLLFVTVAACIALLGCGKSKPDEAAGASFEPPPPASAPPALAPSAPVATRDPAAVMEMNLAGNRVAAEYVRIQGGATGAQGALFLPFPALLRVDSVELNQRAASNVAALGQALDGKRLLISGHVLTVEPGRRRGTYIVVLPGGYAAFDEDADFVATLQAGYVEDFVCTYRAGLASSGYALDGCRGLSREAEVAALMLLTAPAMLNGDGLAELNRLKKLAVASAPSAPAICTTKVSVKDCLDWALAPDEPAP